MSAAPAALEARLTLAFAGARARAVLEPLLAIDAEIAAAARPGIEHAVAHAKLDWWQSEIGRLAQGHPYHPLTRALQATAGSGVPYALLGERVAAATAALVGFAPASAAEFELLLARSHGSLWRVAAAALAGGAEASAAEMLGTATGRILGLAAALDAPSPPLPGDLDLAELTAQVCDQFASARTAVPRAVRASLTPHCVAGALATRLLKRRIQRRRPPAPLSQCWCAWRAAVAANA